MDVKIKQSSFDFSMKYGKTNLCKFKDRLLDIWNIMKQALQNNTAIKLKNYSAWVSLGL